MEDHYEIVGVSRDAAPEEIEQKIKAELRTWQRRTNTADLTRRQEAEQRVELLTQARTALLGSEPPSPKPTPPTAVDAPPRPSRPRPAPPNRRRPAPAEQATTAPRRPPPEADPETGDDYLSRARAALAGGRYLAASEAARHAHSALGPTAEVWILQARANAGLGRKQDADYEIRQALDLISGNMDHLVEIAELYLEMEQPSSAHSIYQRVRKLPGGADTADRGIARIYRATGRLYDAIRLYESLCRRTSSQEDREELAAALLTKAEQIPRIQRGTRYVVTSPDEIRRMRELANRAAELSESPELTVAAGRITKYLLSCEQPATPYRSGWQYAGIMAAWIIPTLLIAAIVAQGNLPISIILLFAGLVVGSTHVLAEYSSAGQPHWQINELQHRRAAPRASAPLLEGPPLWTPRQKSRPQKAD